MGMIFSRTSYLFSLPFSSRERKEEGEYSTDHESREKEQGIKVSSESQSSLWMRLKTDLD